MTVAQMEERDMGRRDALRDRADMDDPKARSPVSQRALKRLEARRKAEREGALGNAPTTARGGVIERPQGALGNAPEGALGNTPNTFRGTTFKEHVQVRR